MLLPATHALVISRPPRRAGLLLFRASCSSSCAASSRSPRRTAGSGSAARSHLLALVATYHGAAADARRAVLRGRRATRASSTPTSRWCRASPPRAPASSRPSGSPPSVHLWRAQVGWMGGFFVWVTAVGGACAAQPRRVRGPFPGRDRAGRGGRSPRSRAWRTPAERLRRFSAQLLPIYAGPDRGALGRARRGGRRAARGALPCDVDAGDERHLSGRRPRWSGLGGGRRGADPSLPRLRAVPRRPMSGTSAPDGWRSISRDPELRMAAVLIGSVAGAPVPATLVRRLRA